MFNNRKQWFEDLEKSRNSKVLLFVTGDRAGLETQIGDDVVPLVASHLDAIGDIAKISLVLYTRGGNTHSARTIVNLILQFCKELEVIVPSRAQSAGTLMCLAAHKVVMTKQATLGPIDPSVNGPLNPCIPGSPPGLGRIPVSTESIEAFFDFATQKGLTNQESILTVLGELTKHIHPLVVGDVCRARMQIRVVAESLLTTRNVEPEVIKKISDFLCRDSGSHDYTINRREAAALGLPIEKPDDDLYALIKSLFADISDDLKFTTPFIPDVELGLNTKHEYTFRRCLLESLSYGSHSYQTKGVLTKGKDQVQNAVVFEGWKHEHKQS